MSSHTLYLFLLINTLLAVRAIRAVRAIDLPTRIPIYVDVLKSGGFQAYIRPSSSPSTTGLQLFAFHSNINAPIRQLESGQYSGIVSKPDHNGYWTHRHASVKLNINDVINYWVYIEVNNTGYTLDCRSYMVLAEGTSFGWFEIITYSMLDSHSGEKEGEGWGGGVWE